MPGEFISPQRYSTLVASARGNAAPWLEFEPETLRSSYNRRPFQLRHRLADHPLFALEPLFALCRRLPKAQVCHRFGVVAPDADFDATLSPIVRRSLSLDDAIDHLEERQAYICIFNPELDPDYRPVIEGLLAEVAAHTEPLDPAITWYSTYIFISARESVTPYHMDREMNFLMQVRGTKIVRLWDPADDEIMTPSEKDYLFTAAHDARPHYQPSFEAKAMIYELRPGIGVHHPFIAPHLVRTGPELSVSFALTFRTRQSDVWSDAHRCNHYLRKIGLRPQQVGRHPLLDGAKAGLVRVAGRGNRGPQAEMD